jgi:hypothetical protein
MASLNRLTQRSSFIDFNRLVQAEVRRRLLDLRVVEVVVPLGRDCFSSVLSALYD